MTRYLINSNPEKGDGVTKEGRKEGVRDKTNSRDASASKNVTQIQTCIWHL